MSSSKKWLEVLKKNDIDFEKVSNKENIDNIQEETPIEKQSLFHRCPDEEFDYLFSNKMIEIKTEFKDFIDHKGLPLLDKNPIFNKKLGFYDFLKIHSKNYIDLCNKIEAEKREVEEENENDEEFNHDINYFYEKD